MNEDSSQNPPKCGLLSLLPKPKNPILIKQQKTKPVTALKPQVLIKENPVENPIKPPIKATIIGVKRQLVAYDSESDTDSETNADEPMDETDQSAPHDFFGLDSNDNFNECPSTSVECVADTENSTANDDISFVGPAKPSEFVYSDVRDDESDTNEDEFACLQRKNAKKIITEEQAKKMIYERELAPFGVSSMVASEAVLNMIDVSVDKALGPNIQENLLKNMNNKVMAQASVGPLPKVKKDAKDRLSKQKHQITHLASLAVAREEQLQEQWAEGRTKKRQTARKYGF